MGRITMAKIIKKLKVGIWQRQQEFDVLWFQQGDVKTLTLDKQSLQSLYSEMRLHLIHTQGKKLPFAFISAISPHQIWHKNLLLPQPLSSHELDQQCRFILEQELPIPLEQIWFDYRSNTLKQGFQLEVFAIQRAVAKAHLAALAPLKIEILDNQVHAIIRAFEYLLKRELNGEDVLIYQEGEQVLVIQPKRYQNQILQQTNLDPKDVYQQFCQRYELQPTQVYIYRIDSALVPLPTNWQEIETSLPLVALGNALWQEDTQEAF